MKRVFSNHFYIYRSIVLKYVQPSHLYEIYLQNAYTIPRIRIYILHPQLHQQNRKSQSASHRSLCIEIPRWNSVAKKARSGGKVVGKGRGG